MIEVNKKKICKLYLSGESTIIIGRLYDVSYQTIRTILIKNKIKIRSNSENSKCYTLNENYFKSINSDEKAYFLGFLFADGCNNGNKTILLRLAEKDSHILKYFNKLLNSNRPLFFIKGKNIRSNQLGLIINNVKFTRFLFDLGIIPNKTFKLKFPNISKKYYKAFILGYFDGDGCIYTGKNPLVNFAGIKSFLLKIQDILVSNCGVNYTKLSKHGNIYYLRYCGRNSVTTIMDWLYSSKTEFLKRKYKKYSDLKGKNKKLFK